MTLFSHEEIRIACERVAGRTFPGCPDKTQLTFAILEAVTAELKKINAQDVTRISLEQNVQCFERLLADAERHTTILRIRLARADKALLQHLTHGEDPSPQLAASNPTLQRAAARQFRP